MEGVVYYIKTDKGLEGVDEASLREMAERDPSILEAKVMAANVDFSSSMAGPMKVKDIING